MNQRSFIITLALVALGAVLLGYLLGVMLFNYYVEAIAPIENAGINYQLEAGNAQELQPAQDYIYYQPTEDPRNWSAVQSGALEVR